MALATKISAFFVLAVPVIAATLVLEDKFPFLAMFVGLANLGTGLTSSWYFIGLGSPWSIVVSDVMPRVLATAMSCVAILIWNAPAVLYGQLLLLASVASVFVSIRVAQMPPGLVLGHTLPRFMLSLRNQRSALIARGVSSLYIALPVTLVSIVNPPAVLVFSAAERLVRMALSILQAVPNAFQSYIGVAKTKGALVGRVQTSIWTNIALGILAGVTFSILAPSVASALFSGVVAIPVEVAIVSGGVIFCTCCSRAVGSLGLVPFRDVKSIAVSAAIGAVLGVTCILVFGRFYAAYVAMVGMLTAEVGVLTFQVISLLALLRAHKRRRSVLDS